MPMKMPKVMDCSVGDCAYNDKKACHAMAVTIGEASDPMCDTFFKSTTPGGVKDMTAGVGACKVSECRHNEHFECAAGNIHVGFKHNHPDCLTFEAR